jgi:hypothetical protein
VILHALRLVNVEGLPEVRVSGLAESGVVPVALPPQAAPGALSRALRFVLCGDRDAVVPEGEGARGVAFVEAGLRTADGEAVSLFRGVDRNGREQVSLREGDGRRVSGGEQAAARLAELLGDRPAAWCDAVLDVPLSDAAWWAAPAAAAPRPPATGDRGGVRDETALAARRAVGELRRALRAERLRLLASRRHAELLDHGARLRHERGTVALEVDRLQVERDRLRTRLRRVNEYRDQLARGGDVPEEGEEREAPTEPPVPRSPPLRTFGGGSALELALVACAAGLFLTLVLYSTSAGGDPDRRTVQIGLGLGFLVAVASYLHVATRRDVTAEPGGPGAAATTAGARDARPWRDALRRRFADLGDPDDPELPTTLRQRLTEHDARLSPLHTRLERLDDAIAVFDVEAGRAARALHETLPDVVASDEGLPEDMDAGAAVALVHELGDAVYAAVVERDALLAEGAVEPSAARQALAVALDAMTDRVVAPDAVGGLLRRVDSFACTVGDDPEEDQLADLLVAEIDRLATESPVETRARRAGTQAPRRGLLVLAERPRDLTDEQLVAHFGAEAQIVVPAVGSGRDDGDRVRHPGMSRRPR